MHEQEIKKQQKLVFGEQPEINLVAACKLGDGVIQHSGFEKKRYVLKFLASSIDATLFIPASGSGSRMFQFLFDFLDEPTDDNRSKTEKFLNAIQEFAFFQLLPFELKEKVRAYDIDLEDFVSYLLNDEGLKLGAIPKGLLPFHRSGSFILNAFQEHYLQGLKIRENGVQFHFTINNEFKSTIVEGINHVMSLTARSAQVSFSEQNKETDAIAFDANQKPVLKADGSILTRPSGHGALLENLQQVKSDVIFIKNIDNVQHEDHASHTVETFQYLGGLVQTIKDELLKLTKIEDKKEGLKALNTIYQFFPKSYDLDALNDQHVEELLTRPIRVCGMVRNEGQPGGGPFWVDNNGQISKQIVEKAQIKMKGEQYRLMVQSQYFNPVLMAVSTQNIFGDYVNLENYSDPSKYFIVDKKFEGRPIKFIERPGLWNGSMAHWLTVFVEVPSATFTPVKNVLDLLNKAHRESL